jgi:hypothetical protein
MIVITPKQIEDKALRQFRGFLEAWVKGESDMLFPMGFPVGRLPMDDFEALQAGTRLLMEGSKARRGFGYEIEFVRQRTNTYGMQSLPKKIVVVAQVDYLALIRRSDAFRRFTERVGQIREQFPQLESWLGRHPLAVLKYAAKWDDLLQVCQYLHDHPRPQLYGRELPLPIHTKFVEQHTGILRALLDEILPSTAIATEEKHFARRFGLRYDQPLIRLRFLDPDEQKDQQIPFNDLSIPLGELMGWVYRPARCLIVENKATFLTLPSLSRTIGSWGGGFRAELLHEVRWLQECELFYWGDLDAHGFQILSRLRQHFPQVQSVMMDQSTLDAFSIYLVIGTATPILSLPHLSTAEQHLYEALQHTNLRLEQEHIPPSYASDRLIHAIDLSEHR